eukprot:m.102703 g.102703  ORF g.102703 m.102703 type:complete len:90 (+) comp13780_c0_seq2:101-370(+)
MSAPSVAATQSTPHSTPAWLATIWFVKPFDSHDSDYSIGLAMFVLKFIAEMKTRASFANAKSKVLKSTRKSTRNHKYTSHHYTTLFTTN